MATSKFVGAWRDVTGHSLNIIHLEKGQLFRVDADQAIIIDQPSITCKNPSWIAAVQKDLLIIEIKKAVGNSFPVSAWVD